MQQLKTSYLDFLMAYMELKLTYLAISQLWNLVTTNFIVTGQQLFPMSGTKYAPTKY